MVLSNFNCVKLPLETLRVIESIPFGEKENAKTYSKTVCSSIPIGRNPIEFLF